jgi:Predicted nucleotide-binding protein containing TIR-like domain
MKPKAFIGSSREGLPIAHAIHANLTDDAECTVWENAFHLSGVGLHTLISNLRESDFGIFVFSPDDVVTMRGTTATAARDNVLFELGLFVGRLGIERCFFLVPDGGTSLHLPTDLAGITSGRYESGRRDGNWTAALSPACMKIREQMRRLRAFQDASIPEPEIKAVPIAAQGPNAARPLPTATNIVARRYKKSILIKELVPIDASPLEAIGASYNPKLGGWILGGTKHKVLGATVLGIDILAESPV